MAIPLLRIPFILLYLRFMDLSASLFQTRDSLGFYGYSEVAKGALLRGILLVLLFLMALFDYGRYFLPSIFGFVKQDRKIPKI